MPGILPKVKVEWKPVRVGVFVMAVFFTLGEFMLSFYFGKADPASTFGPAGSIVLIMLWVYYSSLIVFIGAEFTRVYVRRRDIDCNLPEMNVTMPGTG
jgi:membrane protein